ncbi:MULTISPECIES: nuclear transport factor 2 family protein [unclassified Blastococcus]
MDVTQRLLAVQEIRTLVARRVRCLDTKDWDGFAACHTDDAVAHPSEFADRTTTPPLVGAEAITERVRGHLGARTTVHQLHEPEIEVLSDDAATGVWPLMDVLSWEQDGRWHVLRGYGHYRQTYRRVDGRWLIAEHRLTHLTVESGGEPRRD